MANKTLLIRSLTGAGNNIAPNQWSPMTAIDSFIDNIETMEGNDQATTEQFNTLVSGVPSPWARAKLTSYALVDTNDDQRTLIECYKHMRQEWRGLIAAYALYSDRFQLSEPISLLPKSIKASEGKFDVLNMFGSMLFNETPLWKYFTDTVDAKETAPKIQLLYYSDANNGKTLVGATSPMTLFFCATNYNLVRPKEDDIYWIGNDGKFTDPTPSFRTRGENPKEANNIKKIVSFLKNVNSKRGDYENELKQICRMTYSGTDKRNQELRESCETAINIVISNMGSFIDTWLREIGDISPEWTSDRSMVPVTINEAVKPSGPLAHLYNVNYTYYWFDRMFSFAKKENAVVIDNVQSLFIDSKYLVGFKTAEELRGNFENAPVTYMTAEDNGSLYFFALPFSRFAIDECFKGEVPSIVAGRNENVRLDTTVKAGSVKVILQARIVENNTESWIDILTKEFSIYEPESIGNVTTWPNFASKIWDKYYYYSEYPTNGSGLRVLPVFKELDGEKVHDFADVKGKEDMYLVRYPVDKVDSTNHRYEIICSEYPAHLLALRKDMGDKEWPVGFFMIKTNDQPTTDNSQMRLLNAYDSKDAMVPAIVGIDFGSTNTCAYYKSKSGDSSVPVPFANRRLTLLGFENPHRSLAQKNELLFISNEEPINRNGQVKSWLHQHNSRYINDATISRELVGGVPVNETNITVHAIDENEITTNAGTLCSNMKWLSDSKGEAQKKSYIQMIWIQICADLFAKGYYPGELRWSYPSAMSLRDIKGMGKIYENLETPVTGCELNRRNVKSHTESEAVCSYALSKEVALRDTGLFLGIDIGGSTSDILIMGRGNEGAELYSQCSIRLAANHFFKAITSSARFRKALYKFHESKVTDVKVINIDDIIKSQEAFYSRAPYYLNNVFDQLNGGLAFRKFYNSLDAEVSFTFALPAYLTGILVFYSGMLVRSAIEKNKLESIKSVNMRYYGKGGRTFEWVYGVYEDEARAFYSECFKAGLGSSDIKFVCDNLEDLLDAPTLENKSEVAMGLVNLRHTIGGIYDSSDEDIKGVPVQFRSEVFGEKGFSYTDPDGVRVDIDEMDIVEGSFFRNLHIPESFDNFYKFMALYAKFLGNSGIIKETSDVNELKAKSTKVENVNQFYDNDREYKKYLEDLKGADEENAPSYRMPVFIAEALYYLEKVLLPGVFKE